MFGQGKLKKSLQQLDKDVSKLRSAQASAAEERRGIKAQVAEVKGRVQDGQPQSLAAAAEDISMLPVSAPKPGLCGSLVCAALSLVQLQPD